MSPIPFPAPPPRFLAFGNPDVDIASGRPRAASPQPSPYGDVTGLCFHNNHSLGRWRRGEMSNQKRANEKGRQHRVICGAIGRGVRQAYSASSAVPGASLPSGHLQWGMYGWHKDRCKR